jgi:hypothetical protein
MASKLLARVGELVEDEVEDVEVKVEGVVGVEDTEQVIVMVVAVEVVMGIDAVYVVVL